MSVPNSSCATSIRETIHEEQPRFCVCLQHMPEPTLSPDWFDMQPTQEMNGGQVSASSKTDRCSRLGLTFV